MDFLLYSLLCAFDIDVFKFSYFLSILTVLGKMEKYMLIRVFWCVTNSSTKFYLSAGVKSEIFIFLLINSFNFNKVGSIEAKPSLFSAVSPMPATFCSSEPSVYTFLIIYLSREFLSCCSLRLKICSLVLSTASMSTSSSSDLLSFSMAF